MSPIRFYLILLSILTACAAMAPARADERNIMLLIDGSGSTWGPYAPDRRAKIDIVRDSLTPLIATENQTRIGLASFGHRRRADCTDAEVIVPPETDREPLLTALQKLNPRGKGPLALGLLDAAKAIGTARPASIIFFHDGPDNCGGDVCAAATEIASSNPGLTIHGIGLGVSAPVKEAMACIASTTGGTYTDAATPDDLKTAIDNVAKLTMLAPSPEAVTPSLPIAAAKSNTAAAMLHATVTLESGGKPLNIPVRWSVLKAGGTDILARTESPDLAAKLDPGNYVVEAATGTFNVNKTLTIEPGQDANVSLALDAGRVRVRVSAVKGGEPLPTARVVLNGTSAQAPARVATSANADFLVPPATYELIVTDGAARHAEQIDVAAGTDASLNIVLGTGRLEVSASGDTKPGGGDDDVLYSVTEDDPDSPDGHRQVARARGPTAEFNLPPGTYYVTARSGEAEVRDRIALGAGAVVKHVSALPLAKLTVTATVDGQPINASEPVVYRVTALDGEQKEVDRALSTTLKAQLPPGRYRIDAVMSAHQLTASKTVTLTTEPKTEVIDFDAAQVSFAASGAPAGDHYWEVHDLRGLPIWRGIGTSPKTLLPPGRYTVRLDVRDFNKEAAFEVSKGKDNAVELGPN